MGYLGTNFGKATGKDIIASTGASSYQLSYNPGGSNGVIVFVNGLVQTNYSMDGSVLTFTSSVPASGAQIVVVYIAIEQTIGGGLVQAGANNQITGSNTFSGVLNTFGAITATSINTQPIANYALLASPSFTGSPTAPTATASTNNTQLATTAFVTSAITAFASATGNGVLTFNTRGGSVTLTSADVTTALTYTPVPTNGTGATGTWNIIADKANNLTSTNTYTISALAAGTASMGASGEIRASGNITGYASSDSRLKRNIQKITSALDKVSSISGNTFEWTAEYIEDHGGEDGFYVRKNDVGVIAQEVQAALPEAVGLRSDGYLGVQYDKLVPLLIEAIKELKAEVDTLKGK
jgi:hypothetical protein